MTQMSTPAVSVSPVRAGLARRLAAEVVGTCLLAAVVIGSGIAAQTLSPDTVGVQLLENAAATAAGLLAIILIVGPVSGAHLNPVVSLAEVGFGRLTWRDAGCYIPAQIAGCVAGAITIGRVFSNTFAGIAPTSVPGFITAQLVGGGLGLLLVRIFHPRPQPEDAAQGVLPADPVAATDEQRE